MHDQCAGWQGSSECVILVEEAVRANTFASLPQGQSVPHLHVHVLPRKVSDFSSKDIIYQHLERFGLGLYRDLEGLMERRRMGDTGGVDADEDRKPRSAVDMANEAAWLRTYFSKASVHINTAQSPFIHEQG